MVRALGRLKRRPEFLRVAGVGRKWVTPGLILQAVRRPNRLRNGPDDPAQMRVGFTVSRKVGNAVARNRARRRLKAAASEVLPLVGEAGCDYVIVGRAGTLTRRWVDLLGDLRAAVQGLATGHRNRRPAKGRKESSVR